MPLFAAARHPWLTAMLLAQTRLRVVRHSPMAYGLLMRRPRSSELTRAWIDPAVSDGRIRADIARFARGVDRKALVDIAPRLGAFTGPVHIVWGTADRCFRLEDGRRLAAAFSDVTLTEVPEATTFVSIDAPDAVADALRRVSTAAPKP